MAGRLAVALAVLGCGGVPAQNLLQVHGYVQGRFTDQPGTPDRLEIRRARLILSGEPFAGFSWRFQVDAAKEPYLMDAFIAWRHDARFSLTAGQMKIPFSAESLISDDKNAPVARSRAVLSLSPGRDTGVQGRDVGAEVAGALGRNGIRVEYMAGVFRGQTLVLSPKIHYQATAARIMVHAPGGCAVGGDWYGSFSAPGAQPKRREEVEGECSWGTGSVRAEQIWARDGQLPRRGGYVLGVWRRWSGWEMLARSDWLTSDARLSHTSSAAYIAGANRLLWKHLKLGFDAGAQLGPKPGQWNHIVLAQLMTYF